MPIFHIAAMLDAAASYAIIIYLRRCRALMLLPPLLPPCRHVFAAYATPPITLPP